MGFGPSASGKTHCAKSIIQLMSILEGEKFPTVFFTIDGGIARQQSVIYNYIISLLNIYGISGFNNMKMTGINLTGIHSMFNSSLIKEQIDIYLNKLKYCNNNEFKFSLYIPETLGYCGISGCIQKYNNYINLTNDKKWIGLYIWQHKLGSIECNYKEKYKCIGCTLSGMKREVKEGKKYSNSQYNTSEKNGLNELKKAPIKFKIHNSGGATHVDKTENGNDNILLNKSIIEDLNENRYISQFMNNMCTSEFNKKFRLENFVYINKNKNNKNIDSYAKKYLKYKYKYIKLKKTKSL
jgi:hypothetical protein